MSDIRIKMAKDLRDMSDMVGDLHWMAAKAVEDLTKKEGEIAKRDEELATCRVAVENCDMFRARIAELEARIVWLECEAQVNAAPVSEAKAQGVVMPDVNAAAKALCNRHAMICGVDADDQWKEYSQDFIADAETVLANARLNAAPVQQVSVPDGWKLVPVEPTPKMIDATWYHEIDMSCGIESQGARNKRIYEAMLAAAPAAPAADATVRQATDGGRNQSYEGLFDGETEEQRASRLAAHRAKGVV